MGSVTLRLYADLDALVPAAGRDGTVEVPVELPRSVKDVIESCGVPHTEVDLVLVNGESSSFDRRVVAGDRVSVYPPFSTLRVGVVSKVRPAPLDHDRFVADVHLGRLAEWLRLLGFDTAYRNDADDEELARVSVEEGRWLLSRDRGLLMRSAVTHGYLVRSDDPVEQAVEVVHRFGLDGRLEPLTRCARCNGVLAPVTKEEVRDRLEPGTRARHDDFTACRSCGQPYWAGSHLSRIRDFVEEVRSRAAERRTG
jgi:uncharacterized protein